MNLEPKMTGMLAFDNPQSIADAVLALCLSVPPGALIGAVKAEADGAGDCHVYLQYALWPEDERGFRTTTVITESTVLTRSAA